MGRLGSGLFWNRAQTSLFFGSYRLDFELQQLRVARAWRTVSDDDTVVDLVVFVEAGVLDG